MSPLPTRISRYEIKGLIAQGGMGDLYLALDPNTSRLVVLKLQNATLDSSDVRGRFEREARALASLNHPNVVHIYDYGDFHGAPFIVMEYVRGETLAEQIQRQAPMTLSQKLTLMTELCAGLAQAHEAGIVHRDVKPANLMVDQSGRLKILDFGIARVADSNLTRLSFGPAQGNMQIGTPGYMSPEQIQGGEIDHRTDIFSVGAVCYEVLSYREAFSGGKTREIERQVMQAQPAPLASLMADLDPEIDKIVTRALAKDPKQRYRTVAELGDALESYRLRLGPANTSSSSSTRPARDHERAPHASRGEAAYQRALAADQGGVRDAARRFVIEALAEDPDHAGARALLARFDPERLPPAARQPVQPRPQVPPAGPSTSVTAGGPSASDPPTLLGEPTDQTIVSTRARRPAGPAHADETVFSTRANWNPAPSSTDETVFVPRKVRSAPVTPKNPTPPVARTAQPAPSQRKRDERRWTGLHSLWMGLEPLRTRWRTLWQPRQPLRKRSEPPRGGSRDLWNLYGRSALMVVALVVLIAGTLLAGMRLSRWIWPSGQLLTITKPEGGTISTGGIRCGTRASDCSTERAEGDPVELEAEPDDGFAFGGFTGDCAPTGRTAMTGPRTCGATFERLQAGAKPTLWPLTITPPKGGTILAAGGIQCGSLASECSASLPDGVPVTLHVIADLGYAFLHFTDECAPSGQTMMTGPRTCSATFSPSVAEAPRPQASGTPRKPQPPPPVPDPPPGPGPAVPPSPLPPVPPDPAPSDPRVVVSDKPAPPPITPLEHARREIPEIVKEYCAGLEALAPARIQKVYPSVNVRALQEQFRQYKTLKCTIVGDPKYPALDADGGTAKVEVEVKQTIEMRSGGAPKTVETIAETTMSRPELRSSWRIVNVVHKAKPKP